jgi:hypothetical protein
MIGIATCTAIPDADEESELLRAALAQRGVPSESAAWDDPGADWSRYSAVVIRTAGHWRRDPGRFRRWVSSVPARVIPPAQMVAWNLDRQGHLEELRDAGVNVARTLYVWPDGGYRLPAGKFVVKPAVPAAPHQVAVYGDNDEDWCRAGAHIRALHDTGRTVMIQPYYSSVEAHGETALVYIGGQFAGAVRRDAVLRAWPQVGRRPEAVSPQSAEPDALHASDLALKFITRRFGCPVSARVDILRNDLGVPVVSAVELIDAPLFLRLLPGAVDRLAVAIVRRVLTAAA